MGMEVVAARDTLPAAEELAPFGVVVMVDGALVMPGKPLPATWRELRVKTSAGTVTVAARPEGVAIVVWGNADEPLRAIQHDMAAALTK